MTYILTVIITILLDQASKLLVASHFQLHQSQPLIGSFLRLTHSSNTGGAFGIMSQYPAFFVGMAALLGILGVVLARKIVGLGPWHQAGIGLALGGTMGNLIDRLRLGSVIDFIDFSFWPTFNLADSAICVGAGILIILLLKSESSEKTGEMPSPQEPGPGADAFPAAPLENPGE